MPGAFCKNYIVFISFRVFCSSFSSFICIVSICSLCRCNELCDSSVCIPRFFVYIYFLGMEDLFHKSTKNININIYNKQSMNMNKEVVCSPLASPETTSLTPPPETSASSSEPTSLSPPSSCTNLADPLDSQSKEDDVNTKQKEAVKSKNRRSVDIMTQGTITAAFDKCKRKLTPNKEADTEKDNHKVSRGDAPSI